MKSIRVLHVFHSMNCGGAENMIMNLYRKIDKEKIQFDFLVHTQKKGFFDEEIQKLGGRIYNVPYFNGINYFKYKKEVKKFFASHADEYKIVHGHVGSCAAIYLAEAKRQGLYTIAHSHNTYAKRVSAKDIIYKAIAKKVRGTAKFFLACTMDAGIARFGERTVYSDKFMVLKNAINLSFYRTEENIEKRIKEELKLKGDCIVGHIGRFNEQKNHTFLLDIFKEVLLKNSDSMLLLVGEGNLRGEIEQRAIELGIKEKVVFAGVREDVNVLLNVMDCFVFPSFYEGLGIAAVEAQCVGLPCFINETLPRDLLINDNVFSLSLNDSPERWATEILEKRRKISPDIARQNIISAGYDINTTVKELEEFYLSRGAK